MLSFNSILGGKNHPIQLNFYFCLFTCIYLKGTRHAGTSMMRELKMVASDCFSLFSVHYFINSPRFF
jgi:hypothetical protein